MPHIFVVPVFHRLFLCWTLTVASIGWSTRQSSAQESGGESPEIRPIGNVEQVITGLEFTEGPAWDAASRTLFFTDIPPAIIYRLGPDDQLSRFKKKSRHANGLLITGDGGLLACEMDGQVVRYDLSTKTRTVLASEYEGERFNACNDLVTDRQGGIYFTDPLFRAPQPLPQEVQTVYYRDKNGTVTRVTENIAAPNGIGLSPNGAKLYVIPSRQAKMLVYDVISPGKLGEQRVLCTLRQPVGKTQTGGDGMAVDVEGNLYITTNRGVQIFTDDGQPLGLVRFPEQPANVTFGGPDRQTMYVTARTSLYRVKMPIAGL